MSTDQLLTVGIAACCVLGIGLCAATLDTSVTTQPQDVITVEASWMPVASSAVGELRHRVAMPGSGGDHRPPPPEGPDDGDTSRDDPSGGGSPRDEPSRADETEPQRNEDTGQSDSPVSLLQRLLALLESLLPWLVVLLAVVVTYRLRDRFLGRLRGLLPGLHAGDEHPERRPPVPPDEVSRAWYDMVDRLGVDDWTTKTPEECALAAIAAGYDAEPVLTVTRLFQEVRYGNEPASDERALRARQALDRLGSGSTTSGGA